MAGIFSRRFSYCPNFATAPFGIIVCMGRIFDNIDHQLGPHLQKTLRESDRMDVAVGYFNLRGWSVFNGIVEQMAQSKTLPVARILIGMVTGGPQEEALESLQSMVDGKDRLDADRAASQARRAALLEQLRVQLMRGLPTSTDRVTLQSLRSLLAQGAIQVKVFTRRPLHGKAYIFHRQSVNTSIGGFVGSSNLTWPGLMSNLELNVDVFDHTSAHDLAKWFEDRWNDPFSREVSEDLLALLDESWATPNPRPPYDVFMKVCYELSRDVREGLGEYSIPPEISNKLLDYQTTAVRTLARRVVTRGGTMLGDVVGLGKTLTAIAVALMLRDEHGYMPLVVCPKNLVRMWEEHFEAYGLHGAVVPYSMAHKILPDLRRYLFVIVDESHTLRNNQRRDYTALSDYIRRNESKVLALTATPYNIEFSDVANQLALWIDEDDDLSIAPTNAIAADSKLVDQVDGKVTTLAAFRKSEDPDDWKRLMSENLVRRTRSFIRQNYSRKDDSGREYVEFPNGESFTFPTRKAIPLRHDFGEDDPATILADDDTLAVIENLSLPRYNLSSYLNHRARKDPLFKDWAEGVDRGRGHVAGFVKTMLYKRLSSGGHAFLLSLTRHLARNELFVYALENDLDVPAGTINDLDMLSDEDTLESGLDLTAADAATRYQVLKANAPRDITWVPASHFNAQFATDLRADTEALRALLTKVGVWDPNRDSKLAALIELVSVKHPNEKVLVFTEYKDTADYLGAQLAQAGVGAVAAVTGATDDPTRMAERFSPRSNALPGADPVVAPEDETRILIATDVLSEGQNLQDAHIVVNYDLPWAIIRLIQRAGRVDRIGQISPEVLIYSIFHESIENVISLRQRIAQRLSRNAAVFGSDENFFGSENETRMLNDLYNGSLDDAESAEDVDASSLAYEYWHALEQRDPAEAQRIAALPDLIDATRRKRISDSSEGLTCFVRTASGIDGFGFIDPSGTTKVLTGHETLALFEASPEEPGLDPREDHEHLVTTLVRKDLSTPAAIAGRLRGVRKTVWNRLGATLNFSTFDRDTQAALESLYQHPLTREAERRLRQAIRQGVDDNSLAARVVSLHRDNELVFESGTASDAIRIVSTMGITQ